MSALATLSDDDLAVVILGTLMQSLADLDPSRLSRVLMLSGIKLATDHDGPDAALPALRNILDDIVSRSSQDVASLPTG